MLLARSLLSASETDLVALLREVQHALPVPIHGVISDGQHSIRNAVRSALPNVPHQLCHFHYLREAAKPVYEADRHAKKELKKHLRGVRPIERALEERQDTDVKRWYALRFELDRRQQSRRAQFRFRRDPDTYLAALENKLLQVRLPP